jgi:starch synthase
MNMPKVLFVSSEIAPYAKTGGLADVGSSLPKALKSEGVDVISVMPLYSSVNRAGYGLTEVFQSSCVHMGNCEEWYSVYKASLSGVDTYFIEFSKYFDRPGIYHTKAGEYADNAYRFAFFCRAAMQLAKDIRFKPDVIHCNDWQTGLIPYYIRKAEDFFFNGTKTVMTIHNIGYQGIYGADVLEYARIDRADFHAESFESFGGVNFLKGGIAYADKITTVSPSYAKEIQDEVGGGGLHMLLTYRRYDLEGILNGIDTDEWNPATDKYIPQNFSAETLHLKKVNKLALQERFMLEKNENIALFGFVGRFAGQKGLHLLQYAVEKALKDMVCQFVIIGSGETEYEQYFGSLPARYPLRAGSFIGYSEEAAHLLEAGADFFVMPSLYEPCGLNQMYSLAYGTLPVVRATGGLDDTVKNYNEQTGEGTGFKFQLIDGDALYNTIGWAVSTYYDRPRHIEQMRMAAISEDFGWKNSAIRYINLYKNVTAL